MINIKAICIGIDTTTANAMHESMASAVKELSPFVVSSIDQWQYDMTSNINLAFLKINTALHLQQLQHFKAAWEGVALIAYLDDDSVLPSDALISECHGVVDKNDILSHKLFAIAQVALQIKMREIKSELCFQIVKHLAELTRLQEATASILKRFCELFRWQAGEIWAVDELHNHLTFIVGYSKLPGYSPVEALNVKHHFQRHQGLPGFFYGLNKVAVVKNWQAHLDDDYLGVLKINDFVCCIGIPITFHQQLLGVMVFWSVRSVELDEEMVILCNDLSEKFGEFIKKKRLQGDLLFLAEHDSLTHLANRSVIANNFVEAIKQAEREHNLVALLYLDIDFFKEYNDAYGHMAGDVFLKNIADCMRICVRDTDTVARIGGDEFAILLPAMATISQIELIAKKILQALSHLDMTLLHHCVFSVSIGIGVYPHHGDRFEKLLLCADKALYEIKKNGKNGYKIFPYDVSVVDEDRRSILGALKKATLSGGFRLDYQPIIDIETNDIIGAESLLRLPTISANIGPEIFIPIAEEAGLIEKIGAWVLKQACQDAMNIMAKINRPFKLVVNVSVYQVTREFLSLVTNVLAETKLPPACLTLELTENNLLDLSDYRLEILSSFRALGVRLSIDDFGVGYSSFVYLNKFEVDTIKIDRSFTESMMHQASAKAIVSAILAIAHTLNIQVIAEGVENEMQLDFLRLHQCEFYQGHFFSAALSLENLFLMLTHKFP